MEELLFAVAGSAVGFVANRTAKWGIGVLKAKGVNIPTWVERFAPQVVGAAAGLGTTAEAREIVGRHAGAPG